LFNKVEKLDNIFQRQASAVVQIGRRLLNAAKRAHARITTRYLCVMTFSVWTETINPGNKRFTSKLSTLSGPKDSSSWSGSYVRSGVRLFADSREDIVRLYNEHRAGQFERVGSNGRNLIYENNNRLLSIAFDGR